MHYINVSVHHQSISLEGGRSMLLTLLKRELTNSRLQGGQPPPGGRIQFSSPFLLFGGPGMLSKTSSEFWDFSTTTLLSLTAVCILRTLDWFLSPTTAGVSLTHTAEGSPHRTLTGSPTPWKQEASGPSSSRGWDQRSLVEQGSGVLTASC